MNFDAGLAAGGFRDIPKHRTDRVREADVHHDIFVSKNVEGRPLVRSKNWSGITKSSGASSSFSEPTALNESSQLDAQLLEAVDVRAEG